MKDKKNNFTFAKIAIETTVYHIDQEFLYKIPLPLKNQAVPGCRVFVPFGKANKKTLGLILSLEASLDSSELNENNNIKEILRIIDDPPILNAEFLSLIKFMKSKYYCTFFEAVKIILPGLVKNRKEKLIKIIKLSSRTDFSASKFTEKQRSVIDTVAQKGELSIKEICYFTGVTASVIEALVRKGVLECIYQEKRPIIFQKKARFSQKLILTPDQQNAYNSLCKTYVSKEFKTSLLYGVTGSGKTSVFIKMIEKAQKDGKDVIIMVPEIALTPQMTNIFYSQFGKTVAVFHSSLSSSQRFYEWKRVKNGEAKIVIGTRSAVFAPFENIGLIILDEEQESSYKSECTPRYHAREIAKFRCKKNNALLILCSATPSIESYFFASKGQYTLAELPKRYGNAQLPKVSIVDMNNEVLSGNCSMFSSQLIKFLRENLSSQNQSILLLNRRGYHTFISCRSCKEVIKCPKCSISMIYHKANNRLMCHYCGYSTKFSKRCPHCNEEQVHCSGVGTQKLEQELQKFLPSARVLRMDSDTTMQKYSHEKKLTAFANLEYDILVGTQMVAKGLDFPNVTLVGVLLADNFLYSSDFRSYEKTFALLTQVVGRSGRGQNPGRAVIQTFTPENPIISLAAKQNYQKFYDTEIMMRKAMLYPPFTGLCVVGFAGLCEMQTLQAAIYFFNVLVEKSKTEYQRLPLRVLGPSPYSILKVNNKYRYKIIIKFRDCKEFRDLMAELKTTFQQKSQYRTITCFVDPSPI